MLKYFALYRPLNIFFIALAQLLCAYYLDPYASINQLVANGVLWIILGTLACSSFGYWLNDFLDKERDSINKVKTFDISNVLSSRLRKRSKTNEKEVEVEPKE
jgi:4-hydroxybenzoate polyprenyltransferase